MATQVELLMARLRDIKFRKELLELCDEATRMAGRFYNDDYGEKLAYLHDTWFGSLDAAMDNVGWIPELLEESTKALSNPRIILPGELWEEFEVYLDHECSGISGETYDAYLDHIEHRFVKPRKSEPFALCTLSFPEGAKRIEYMMYGALMMRANILGNVSKEEIQKSTEALTKDYEESPPEVIGRIGEFEISLERIQVTAAARGLRKPNPDDAGSGTLYVTLSAWSSAKAMDALVAELAPLAQSHFRSVEYVEPCLNVENFKNYQAFAMSGLEMAVRNTSNKDTFQRRIANAVRLLAEADNQRSEPIGLSLCVAAIDALLSRKGQEMTNKLADFVAGLLEPEVALRRQAADYVTDLYDKRSRVLHGDKLEGDANLHRDARQLAASVLYGVWSYQDFFERFYDDTPKPDEFFGKLREDFVKPGLPDGVLELPVRSLWKSAPP